MYNSIWYHQPFRADEWMLWQHESPSAGQSRCLSTSRVYSHGVLVASATQEGLIRITPKYKHATSYNPLGEPTLQPSIDRKTSVVQTANGATSPAQKLTYGEDGKGVISSSNVHIQPVSSSTISVPRHVPLNSRL
jgi:hypothetical protein